MDQELIRLVVIVNAASTWWMTGLVWFVQIVHYPLFENVGRSEFKVYHEEHVRRTRFVVLVPMVLELILSLLIALSPQTNGSLAILAWVGVACVCGVWSSTFLWQVPDHDRLGQEFAMTTLRSLLRGNGIRSAIWSIHSVIVAIQCLVM